MILVRFRIRVRVRGRVMISVRVRAKVRAWSHTSKLSVPGPPSSQIESSACSHVFRHAPTGGGESGGADGCDVEAATKTLMELAKIIREVLIRAERTLRQAASPRSQHGA